MESFGIQASQAKERCGKPRRVRINALARQKARSRDAKQMKRNNRFDYNDVESRSDSINHKYIE